MTLILKRQNHISYLRNLKKNPVDLIRLVVLLICIVVVSFQVAECVAKLLRPPVTTHSRFELSDTIYYPAVTFCRDPPYKVDVLNRFGLGSDPRLTTNWRSFPFDENSTEEIFQQGTYNSTEYFLLYGLDGNPQNVEIVSSIHFSMGQCQTVIPLVTTDDAWKNSGYFFLLYHDIESIEETTSPNPPGWHMFIHELKVNFSEIFMPSSGRVDYMYIDVSEEIEVKLSTQQFKLWPSRVNKCSEDYQVSAFQCLENCFWDFITKENQCKGPWMSRLELPLCNNFTTMRRLIVNYFNTDAMNKSQCECYEPCNLDIYSSFVIKRGKFFNAPILSSQVWLYYTSKMVMVTEEKSNYDGTQFLSDIGGSLGFLLGLSVLGFIGYLEKVIVFILEAFREKKPGKGIDAEAIPTISGSDQNVVVQTSVVHVQQ